MTKKHKLLRIFGSFVLLTGLGNTYAFEIESTSDFNLCLDEMSPIEQEQRFSRIVNMGASFSKGCFTCDFNPDTRKHLKEIGEYGWVNRHFLIKFLKETDWKNPGGFAGDVISVVENDPKHDATQLLDTVSEVNPYSNVWKLDYGSSYLGLYSENELDGLLKKDPFKLDSNVVGGLRNTVSTGRDISHTYGGHLYQTTPGIWNGEGGREKSIFDFAVDGTRSSEIFSFLGDENLYNELVESGWKNQEKRTLLMKIVGEKIAATQPSVVVAGDALFWDSVPRLLARIHKTKGISWITKVLTNKIIREKLLGKVVYPIDQEQRMISDFLQLMSNLSTGEYGNKPVPVVVARLIHNLGYEFENPVFAKDFGLFVGNVLKNLLGYDLRDDIVKALKNFKRSDYESLYKDEDMSEYLAGHDPGVESEGFKDWVMKKVLKNVVKDLPRVVMALERSFNETNMILKKFVNENNSQFKVIEVDDFYRSIPYSVSPVTIHPSSYGSMVMSGVFKDKLCD